MYVYSYVITGYIYGINEVPMAKTERFELRFDEDTISRVDMWREGHQESPSRAEAMRKLIELGLSVHAGRTVAMSDGEKLLAFMLSDIYQHLKIEDGEVNPEFIKRVIGGGHYWAPKWEMEGIFHDSADDPNDVQFVVDVLDMWCFIEEACEKFSESQKAEVTRDSEPFDPKFFGFDGNNEGQLYGIADFLIKDMGRFQRFKKRGLNSHMPTRVRYARMLGVFLPMRVKLARGGLSPADVVAILIASRAE